MSDRLSQRSPSWSRPKTFVFAGIAIMTAYVLFCGRGLAGGGVR